MGGYSGFEQLSIVAGKGRRTVCMLSLLLLLLLPGCGDEEGSPPVLTDLRYQSPEYMSGFKYRGDNPVMIGTVGFQDPDGDLAILTVGWQDCEGAYVNKYDVVQEDRERTKTGEIPFLVEIDTDCPIGEYAVRLSATDGRGLVSNVLRAEYEIYAAPEGG